MSDTRSYPGSPEIGQSDAHEEIRLLTLWFEQQIENARQDQISGFSRKTEVGTLRGERAHARQCAMYEAQQMFLAATRAPQPLASAQTETHCGAWQPIETAPRDGTLIEVKGTDGPYGVTSFEGLARWSTPTNWHKDQSNWTSTTGAVLALAGYKPSHWRPRGSVSSTNREGK